MLDEELAKHFKVAVISIARWRRKLGLKKIRLSIGSPNFRNNKENFIREHNKHTDADLAIMFNISVSGVEKWRVALGLKKDQSKIWEINEHPKGYTGHKHSDETRKKLGIKSKAFWDGLSEEQKANRVLVMMKTKHRNGTLNRPRHKTTWKQGWREIGGRRNYYRSRWEANYARYLERLKSDGLIINWEFEPDTFWFENIKRGVRSYLPDFKITCVDNSVVYHEVKGWMDKRSATKLKRMAKYYPEVEIVLIQAKQYNEIKTKMGRLLEGWE